MLEKIEGYFPGMSNKMQCIDFMSARPIVGEGSRAVIRHFIAVGYKNEKTPLTHAWRQRVVLVFYLYLDSYSEVK